MLIKHTTSSDLTNPINELDPNTTKPVGRLDYHRHLLLFHYLDQLLLILRHNESPWQKSKVLLSELVNHLLIGNPQAVLPTNNKQAWELVNLHLQIGTRGATHKY